MGRELYFRLQAETTCLSVSMTVSFVVPVMDTTD